MDNREFLVCSREARVENALSPEIHGELTGFHNDSTIELQPTGLVRVKNDDGPAIQCPTVLLGASFPAPLHEFVGR